MRKKLWPALVSTLLITSCASAPKLPAEIEKTLAEPGVETIVLMGTNDIHGTMAPLQLKTREPEGVKPTPYEAGGLSYLASYVRILREQFLGRFLWLDGGDEFQGSIDSNLQKGAPMVRFFNADGLNGAAIGNHEFDFGPANEKDSDPTGSLKQRMSEAQYPYLAANIVDRRTGRLAEFPNTYPSKIYSVGDVKVGVIGLSTLDTPRTTRADNVRQLQFSDLKEATLREAASLRKQGADIIVVVSHVGLACEGGKLPNTLAVRKPGDPQGTCGSDDEMVKYLRALPEGTVDAVISGHSHQIVHHWIHGVPVVQGGAFGRYFNLIYLPFDKVKRKVIAERVRIEGPVPVCPEVFANQDDCNGDRQAPKDGRGSLRAPVFHGQKIKSDPAIEAVLKPAFDMSEEAKKKIVGQAARTLEHERFRESPLGDLVADALRESVHADFALMNAGGVRAPIQEGRITYEDAFRSLPFDNMVSTLRLTGRQLRMLLRVAESGSRGFPSVSGLSITLVDPAMDAPSTDLDGNHKIEPWEINRLLDVKAIQDGKLVPIKDDKTYTLATIDFLVTGGDDLHWVMSQIPDDRKQLASGEVMRDAFVHFIAGKGPLNAADHPIVNPELPRIKFEKPAKGHRKSRGRRRRRHR